MPHVPAPFCIFVFFRLWRYQKSSYLQNNSTYNSTPEHSMYPWVMGGYKTEMVPKCQNSENKHNSTDRCKRPGKVPNLTIATIRVEQRVVTLFIFIVRTRNRDRQ